MPDPTDSHFLLIDNTLSFSGHAPPPPTFGVGGGEQNEDNETLGGNGAPNIGLG